MIHSIIIHSINVPRFQKHVESQRHTGKSRSACHAHATDWTLDFLTS